MRDELLPLVDYITPNTDELAVLVGSKSVHPSEIPDYARELQQLGRELTVIVTGGHLSPPDDYVMQPHSVPHVVAGEYIGTNATHGTGCAYSAALLSHLLLGADTVQAAESAKKYVRSAMHRAEKIGHGKGPLDLLWPLK